MNSPVSTSSLDTSGLDTSGLDTNGRAAPIELAVFADG